jgi:ElaB/YqjD/DUF883 family membrane-anchored ribosome-binding protein
MFTLKFWKDAIERALKTAAQAGIVVIGTSQLVTEVDWVVVVSGAALGFILSILTSIASSAFGDGDSASLVDLG